MRLLGNLNLTFTDIGNNIFDIEFKISVVPPDQSKNGQMNGSNKQTVSKSPYYNALDDPHCNVFQIWQVDRGENTSQGVTRTIDTKDNEVISANVRAVDNSGTNDDMNEMTRLFSPNPNDANIFQSNNNSNPQVNQAGAQQFVNNVVNHVFNNVNPMPKFR